MSPSVASGSWRAWFSGAYRDQGSGQLVGWLGCRAPSPPWQVGSKLKQRSPLVATLGLWGLITAASPGPLPPQFTKRAERAAQADG